ncbi:membrane protein [Kitasatospora griseola]|uniref:Zinc metalloprotease n=1 Tax=Kitasatospora griseola TaxID=2064 RepID=A0A0D0Q0Z8_KITGR|nr:M50 family metallopeptidase [Kitasatospora griseola]KIQ64623.1 membrane protein [Kitasatospora griseola]
MNGSVPAGRIFGIPLRIHWSAPLLVVFLGFGLADQTLQAWVPGQPAAVYGLAGAAGALLLMVSLLLHETAHAITARRLGTRVDDMTVFALGGVTRMGRPATPKRQLAVTLAGPLTSLALAALAIAAGLGTHHALHWTLTAAVLLWTGWANLVLGVFNLLPAAPLDGGRVLQAIVWWRGRDRESAERIAGRSGQVTGVLLSALGAAELLNGAAAGFWLVLIGLFMWSAATAEVGRAALVGALRGLRVSHLMSAPVVTGPDWTTVERFLADVTARTHHTAIPLVDFEGRPSRLVDLRRLTLIPPPDRAQLRVRDVATPLTRCALAAPCDDLVEVLDRIAAPPPILVLDAGRLVGIITADDIERTARRRLAAASRSN